MINSYDFSKDVVIKTKTNLEQILNQSLPIENKITNLLNLFYGLVHIPSQKITADEYLKMPQDLQYYHLSSNCSKGWSKILLKDVISHLSKTWQVGNIRYEQESQNGHIQRIVFFDTESNKEIIFTTEQLRKFPLKFSEEYLKLKS